jgi:hypothetical protein
MPERGRVIADFSRTQSNRASELVLKLLRAAEIIIDKKEAATLSKYLGFSPSIIQLGVC